MFFQDLEVCSSFSAPTARVLAVGWLDADHEFSRGPVDPKVFSALFDLLRDPWQPAVAVGIHRCALCRFTGGPGSLQLRGSTVQLGANNLYVPAPETIFVAPSLILHAIDSHEYCPPKAFQDAVLACPPMRSVAYLKLVKGLAPRGSAFGLGS
jgi:hypothetical protein